MNSVEIQRAFKGPGTPDSDRIRCWAATVLDRRVEGTESVIRMVDIEESAALNSQFRKKSGPTNVLSFSYGLPVGGQPVNLLGDLVICAPVVAAEAEVQAKDLDAHWAHMVVHGYLHLLGYDHTNDPDAMEMEALEMEILGEMGYPDPYQEVVDR